MQQPGWSVLYVRNLTERVDAATLLRECIHPSRIDVSQREAYILFESRAAAATNLNNLNGMVIDGQRVYCHIVQHHSETKKVILLQYGIVLIPQSRTYTSYIAHRLKHLDEGIALYTTPKHTRLAFDKFIRAQSTMDGILNDLVTVSANSSQRCLIVIGGSEFPSNSPIKKYRRCPGVRKLVAALSKRSNCDVVFADEYNTSQVCARCYRKFKTTPEEEQKHKRWERAGHRHRSCSDCCPSERLLPLPIKIHTKLSPGEVTISMLEQAHTNFTQNNIRYEEAKQHAMQSLHCRRVIGMVTFFTSRPSKKKRYKATQIVGSDRHR